MANTDSTRSLKSDDGAAFAREYLRDLKSDPSSVDLDGFVDDMKHQPNDQVGAFFDVLQDALVGASSRIHAKIESTNGDKRSRVSMVADLEGSIIERTAKVKGICELASLAQDKWDQIPSDALPDAMWAVRDLLTEIEGLCERARADAIKSESTEASNV